MPSSRAHSRRPLPRLPLPLLFVVLGALALALAACSSSGSPSGAGAGSTTTGGTGPTITIQNFQFSPTPLTVKVGMTVRVVNKDQVAHTVTALDGSFDTGDISGGGGTASFAVHKAGTFAYKCTIHPFMHGSLTVTS